MPSATELWLQALQSPPAVTETLQQRGWSAFHWWNLPWHGLGAFPDLCRALPVLRFPKPKAVCALPASSPCSGELQPSAGCVLQCLQEVKVQQSVLQPKASVFFLQNYGAARAKIALGHVCLLPTSLTHNTNELWWCCSMWMWVMHLIQAFGVGH